MLQTENLSPAVAAAATAAMGGVVVEPMTAHGSYRVECRDAAGALRWADAIDNLLTTQGKNHLLDTYLAGSAYTAAFVLSLYTAGTIVATATYAAPVVTEVTSSVLATRPAVTWNAAASGSKSSAAIACTFGAGAASGVTITGVMMLKGSSTIADTAQSGGVLLSAALLTNARQVFQGDTLNVTYSLSV